MRKIKFYSLSAVLISVVGLFLPLQIHAQTARTASEEYDEVIKGVQTITALGPNLFGEAVNLKDGATSFSAIDVKIPTNSGLPLSIGRQLGINSRDADKYVDPIADGELFGNWKLDVPVISGTFDERTGWVSTDTSRCSNVSAPPAVKSAYTNWNLYYYSEDYWRGNTIHIPGKGMQTMLGILAGRALPSDGKTYRWTTKDNWAISCIPLKNGAGEGFLVTLPDGTRYSFDWMSSRRAAALKDTHCDNVYLGYEVRGYNVNHLTAQDLSRLHRLDAAADTPLGGSGGGSVSGGGQTTICNTQIVVNRREYFLHATKVEDRNGNAIVYTYDSASPRRLLSVASSDGGSISLSYNASGKVGTVSANGRQWQYQYEQVVNYGSRLVAVVLPDNSRWTFQYGELATILDYDKKIKWPDCEPFVAATTIATLTIGHPSGASGAFSFQNMLHGVDRTPGVCSVPNPDRPLKVDLSHQLMVYKVASLLSKQISGPGLSTQTWNYSYQPSWSWNLSGYVDSCTQPTDCNSTTTTEVTAPDGTVTRSVFGNDYYRSAGQLQRVEVRSAGNAVKSTTFSYMPSAPAQAYASRAGVDLLLMNNPFETEQQHPLQMQTTVQDGDSYHWIVDTCGSATAYCFDAFARPMVVRKQNSMGGYKREVTEYHDNTNLWVLGQVARVSVPETSINGTTGSVSVVVAQVDYNAQALPWRRYAFGKLQDTMTYYADGTLATVADGNGKVTTLSAWRRGIPGQVQFPATPEAPSGATQSAVIEDNGWVRSVTDETGAKTCYDYDVMGRLSNVLYPSETQVGACDTSRWSNRYSEFRQLADTEWMPSGIALSRWRRMTSEGNHVKVTYMDAMWRPVLVHEYDAANVGPTLRSTRYGYDALGRQNFQSYPMSDLIPALMGTRTSYDALDRVIRVEQDGESSALVTATEYLTGLKIRVTNPRGYQTTTQFMAWDAPNYDLLISSTQPEGKIQMIERHPRFGWPQRLTQRSADYAVQQSRNYVYDGNAQLCKTIEPETGVSVMGYDGAGNMTWQAQGLSSSAYGSTTDCQHAAAFGSGVAATREYDARNRLSKLNFAGGGRGNQIWTYEKDNLPASVTAYNDVNSATSVVTAYTYNKRRLITGESLSQPGWYTWAVGYDYDSIGNLRWQSYPTGLVLDYAPNAMGQATQARDTLNRTYASAASYYPNGALKQFTYGNGIVHTMTQNARQLPARVTSSGGVSDFGYTYDNNGNVASIWDYARDTGNGFYGRWMTYDGLDRLTSAGSCTFGGDCWHRFTYDALDNIKSWKLGGVKDYADYVYDQNNRLTSIRNTAGATVVGIGYDAQGNLQNKNGQTYEFDYGNRLRAVTNKEAYRYDGLGRRVLNWRWPTAEKPNGTLSLSMYTQAGQLVYQWDDQYPKYSENIYLAGSIIAIRDIASPSNMVMVKYQHTDALGSPVAVTNEVGAVVERNDYEPYGAIIGKPAYSGIGYTGHVMDGTTGLTYMQQRYYDQSVGRFLSLDPVAVDVKNGWNFNRYSYVANNPYKFRDPDGRCLEDVCIVEGVAACIAYTPCAATVAAGVAYVGYKATQALKPLGDYLGRLYSESADAADDSTPEEATEGAINGLREGKQPVPGTAGERGELQGNAEDADTDFENLAATPGAERKDENNIRMPDGSSVNRHESTRPYRDGPPAGTTTIKHYPVGSKVPTTTVRYPPKP